MRNCCMIAVGGFGQILYFMYILNDRLSKEPTRTVSLLRHSPSSVKSRSYLPWDHPAVSSGVALFSPFAFSVV